MTHTNKGTPKILKSCTLPLTAKNQVNMIVTEMGVMVIKKDGIHLIEYNPEYTLEEIKNATEANLIVNDLTKMKVEV
jgi:acyl CoA:acetate/3-ketoacid CoA transferase beta subunit